MKMDDILKNKGLLAIVPMTEPSPAGYMNLYEPGDIWLKIKGCEECPAEQRKACCGKCPLVSEYGCFLHIENKGQHKPFACIVQPRPDKHRPNCAIEIKCIKGRYLGLIRRLQDKRNILRDKNNHEFMIANE